MTLELIVLDILGYLYWFDKQERLSPEQFRAAIVTKLDKIAKMEGRQERQGDFALSSLIDEVALSKEKTATGLWSNYPLQFLRFATRNAGVDFYKRLETQQAVANKDVIKVYYLCLLYGFKGKYLIEGESKRQLLIKQLHHDLASIKSKTQKRHRMADLVAKFPLSAPVFSLAIWVGALILINWLTRIVILLSLIGN